MSLKPGTKYAYVAQVKDAEGNHPVHGSEWWVATTSSNTTGHFSTHAAARDLLSRSIRTYQGGGKLIGHVTQIVVEDDAVTLANIDPAKYITGNVVPIESVPSKYREQYRDTVHRVALAAYKAGIVVHAKSSFRTEAEQEALYARYLAGGTLAARPGTSAHEIGEAMDIQNARNMPKFIQEARKLALMDDVPSEAWHLTNHHRV